ncbi:MAG: CBS domain-containing protein [Arenicella sp.]|nr:CBS domain-containing protein [Arenicella sp.]
MTNVGNILTSKGQEIWSIAPDKSIFDALEIMADKNVSGLLVLESGKLVGIFTERDYARKLILKGKSSKNTNVSDLMSKNILYVKSKNTVEDCMKLMTAKRVRHLPVIDSGRLIGIVTIGDLVKQIISEQQTTIHQLENYISGGY